MKTFDKWLYIQLDTDKDGRLIYFPWGVLGAGYVIDDESRGAQIRRFIKQDVLFLTVGFVLLSYMLESMVLWPLFFAALCFYHWRTRALTAGLEKVPETTCLKRNVQKFSASYSWPLLACLQVVCIVLTAGGLWSIVVSTSLAQPDVIALFGTIAMTGFFGFLLYLNTLAMIFKWSA